MTNLPTRSSRQSSIAAARKIAAQLEEDAESDAGSPRKWPAKRRLTDDAPSRSPSTKSAATATATDGTEKTAKRRKTAPRRNGTRIATDLYASLFGAGPTTSSTAPMAACLPPTRRHGPSYHRPLLLAPGRQGRGGRQALLRWFDADAGSARVMPWRKPWTDLDAGTIQGRSALERRAYEVWISEVMLQQTRVAVVVDYWNRWMARWPTIQDLAAAAPADVLAAWRGLGYYSRATRIHEAARLVVGDPDMGGLLPADAAVLEAKVPGVGRYTAGAIAAIVFGRAAPLVDGNVLRVLSRQLGIFGNVKTDKTVVDVLWAAADALVKAVARDGENDEEEEKEDDDDEGTGGTVSLNDRPGRWGQALMELGSTVCTPKPDCASCPITSTCRAYGEGLLLTNGSRVGKKAVDLELEDIEDACTLCEPFEEVAAHLGEDGESEPVTTKQRKGARSTEGATRSSFFADEQPEPKGASPTTDARSMAIIVDHARKFPVKIIKKAVRAEDTLVCAIRDVSTGRYLIQKRPEKGLLAGLWEFPSHPLSAPAAPTPKARKKAAEAFVSGLMETAGASLKMPRVKHAGELGSVPWLFSHLKLTMHVHLFLLEGAQISIGVPSQESRLRWASSEEVENESMGTGMRKCWALIKDEI